MFCVMRIHLMTCIAGLLISLHTACHGSSSIQSENKGQEYDVCIKANDTKFCPSPVSPTSAVYTFCEQANHTVMHGRCCIKAFKYQGGPDTQGNYTHYVIGLDLSMCDYNIESIPKSSNSSVLYEKAYLKVLMLEQNEKSKCKGKTFDEMGYLEHLSLPPTCRCPGPAQLNSWLNESATEGSTVCRGEIDFCGRYDNYTCPNDRSTCIMYSPGQPWCVCKDSYYGYKCLLSGHFPIIAVLASFTGGTILISAFLWFTQRRHVII